MHSTICVLTPYLPDTAGAHRVSEILMYASVWVYICILAPYTPNPAGSRRVRRTA